MNISQVAKLTRLSAKSIRFYESKEVIVLPLGLKMVIVTMVINK